MTATYADRQLGLFDDPITARFVAFHHDNPHVYREIVRLARQRLAAGHAHGSIAQVFEVLRWQTDLTTTSRDGLKLNNDLRAPYARLVMANEPDLRDFFHTRRADGDME